MKTVILLCSILLSHRIGFSQAIVKDEVDKYTKSRIKETDFFWLKNGMLPKVKCRFRLEDTTYYVDVMLLTYNGVEGANKVYFLLNNDESVILSGERYGESKVRGSKGGVYNLGTSSLFVASSEFHTDVFTYEIDKTAQKSFLEHFVAGLRVDHGRSATTFDNIKEKFSTNFQTGMILIH
jgi:hypothetical protein